MSRQLPETAKIGLETLRQIEKKRRDKRLKLNLMERIVVGYFSVVQLKAIRNRGNSQSFWISNESAISRKSIIVKGMSTRGKIDPCPVPKQDHSPLSLLIHHPHTVLVTNTRNTRPLRTNSLQISQPAQVTPVRRRRGGSREALTARRCPRITAHGCYPDCYPK